MISLGLVRCVTLMMVALLGILGQVVTDTTGPALPDIPQSSLVSDSWGMLYGAAREAGVLAAILAVIVTCVQQVREQTAPGSLVLAPVFVLAYLAMPAVLPDDLGVLGALLVLFALLAICLGCWADLQPDHPGRPAYYSALGLVLATVIYVGALDTAVGVPALVMGPGVDQRVQWALELLALLVAPAALLITPGLKLVWQRPSQGAWWS